MLKICFFIISFTPCLQYAMEFSALKKGEETSVYGKNATAVRMAKEIEKVKKGLHKHLSSNIYYRYKNSENKKRLLVDLAEYSSKLLQHENNSHSVDELEEIKLSHPHSVLNFERKALESLHGFRGIEPFILKNIKKICIKNNQLTYIPLGTILEACPWLEELDASSNDIHFIAYHSNKEVKQYAIAENNNLKKLLLGHNALTDFDFDEQFTATPNLEILDLSWNKQLCFCSWEDASVWSHCNESRLPKLNLSSTPLNAESIKELYTQYITKTSKTIAYWNRPSWIITMTLPFCFFLGSIGCRQLCGFEQMPVLLGTLAGTAGYCVGRVIEMGYAKRNDESYTKIASAIAGRNIE